jgi:hypothetical protein
MISIRVLENLRRASVAAGLLAGSAGPAWSQESPGPGAPAAPAADGGGAVLAIVLLVGLVVVLAIGVRLFDVKRKHDADALYVQAQISDALLQDPRLYNLPITATAHVPVWRGSPVTVELTGEVPTPGLRDTALSIARHEAARLRSDVLLDDRLSVVPARAARIA